MPNHVHVLIKQGDESNLSDIVQRWKGSSSSKNNLALKREGNLWAKDYFDRVIRDGDHFWNAVSYIHRSPVRAGLATEAADWPYSSLGHGWPLPQSGTTPPTTGTRVFSPPPLKSSGHDEKSQTNKTLSPTFTIPNSTFTIHPPTTSFVSPYRKLRCSRSSRGSIRPTIITSP